MYITLGGPALRIVGALLVGPVVGFATGKRMGLLLWWKPFDRDDVAELARLIRDGALTPAIDRRYPLEEIVEALRWVDDGHAKGKVIVTT